MTSRLRPRRRTRSQARHTTKQDWPSTQARDGLLATSGSRAGLCSCRKGAVADRFRVAKRLRPASGSESWGGSDRLGGPRKSSSPEHHAAGVVNRDAASFPRDVRFPFLLRRSETRPPSAARARSRLA